MNFTEALAPPLPAGTLAACMLVVLMAGIVRGFSGFGFSALCVAALSLFMPPSTVVPTLLLLEIVASLSLVRGALRHHDRPWLYSLAIGSAITAPLGVAMLAWWPETPIRAAIGATLLMVALALRSGWQPRWSPTAGVRFAVGLISGVFNGLAAIGGVVVAALLSTSVLPPQAMRATLILLFLFTDLYWLATAAVIGHADAQGARSLLSLQGLALALWLAPAMLIGVAVGSRLFRGISPQRFRELVLNLLMVLAALAVLRAVLQALG